MVSWSLQLYIFITVVAVGAVGTRLDPDCPRHRGLPDGFSRSENRIRDRALFRLDLRSAIEGFIPEKTYRFRVHTTARKFKFNDATVSIDAVDENCGAGSWVTDTDELYSPKGCPSIVTTQQKQPMGRAHFKWRAPTCGCVHFRVRVHANATYYIDDETVRNGPLARTICPQAGTVKEPVTNVPVTTKTILPKVLTRNERLQLLCDVSEEHKVEDVMKNEDFMSKRTMSKLSSFELDRLNIAVERRHLEILKCCDLKTELEKSECFGDIRRIRIDAFCGSGEPDIPLTKTRYDWIKQKQPECCPQIGEARYTCFNHTLYEEDMMKDGHGHHTSIDMDDFDPVNYVEDYPQAEEIRTKFSKKRKHTAKVATESGHNVQYQNVEESPVVKSQNTDSGAYIDDNNPGDNTDDDDADNDVNSDQEHKDKGGTDNSEEGDDDNDDDSDVDSDQEHKDKDGTANSEEGNGDKNEDTSEKTKEDDARTRYLSLDECCMNGIDAGTRVAADGFDGCFKMADIFDSYFTKWHRKCDRHFVICCMRVIDGDFQEVPKFLGLRKLLLPRKHACYNGKLSVSTLNTRPDTQTTSTPLELLKYKKEKLRLKQIKIRNQNKIVKLKDDNNHAKPRKTSFLLVSKHKMRHYVKYHRRKHDKQAKFDTVKRKKYKLSSQNQVYKKGFLENI